MNIKRLIPVFNEMAREFSSTVKAAIDKSADEPIEGTVPFYEQTKGSF